MVEIIYDITHRAHIVSIGIHGTVFAQCLDITEADIIGIAGTEEIGTLEKLDSKEQYQQCGHTRQAYLDFLFHLSYVYTYYIYILILIRTAPISYRLQRPDRRSWPSPGCRRQN